MHINWAEQAVRDLDHIRMYYAAQGSPGAAGAVLAAILAAAEAIGEMPQRGRSGRVAGTRELVVPHTSPGAIAPLGCTLDLLSCPAVTAALGTAQVADMVFRRSHARGCGCHRRSGPGSRRRWG